MSTLLLNAPFNETLDILNYYSQQFRAFKASRQPQQPHVSLNGLLLSSCQSKKVFLYSFSSYRDPFFRAIRGHTIQNSQNKQIKISDLETNIFELKMMMKSGLEFFILKSYQPLQSCCCPVQKNLPRKAELAWQVSRYLRRGQQNLKIKNSRPLFTIIFSSKMLVSRPEILVYLFQEFQLVCTYKQTLYSFVSHTSTK